MPATAALVTGATGFLGRYIVEQLVAQGSRVRVLVRRDAPELAKLGVEIARGDITDRERVVAACEGTESVYHVAAVAGIWGPWQHFHSINVLGTEHVLAGCQRHGVARLIYTSSPSVTFAGDDQAGVDESVPYPPRWLCHYPHTKTLAEQAVLRANEPGRFLTCALRPHLIWGPRDGHLVPRLIARARSGQLRRVGAGQNLIDMVYVENAAEAHLLADRALQQPNSPAAGKAYFISQGEPVNCWDWIDELLALAKLPPLQRSISLPAAYAIGAAFEGAYRLLRKTDEPRMTRFLALQLGKHHYFDISAARRELGYSPRVSIAEGMQRLSESEVVKM